MIAELLLLALTIAPSPGPPCSLGSVGEDGIEKPWTGVQRIPAEELVRETPVIVRATAVREVSRPGEQGSRMVFRVVEVLKGEQVPDSIDFAGYVHDADDFNAGPVPYAHRRKGNVGGSCYVYSYKPGAEYLLFLEHFEPGLTPCHSIFSPTNEQLRGPDDPWLRWVRDRIPPAGSRTAGVPAAAAGAEPDGTLVVFDTGPRVAAPGVVQRVP